MTSRRLMFIQLSQLTRCPLYVSPFFSSTSMGWFCAVFSNDRGSIVPEPRSRRRAGRCRSNRPRPRAEPIRARRGPCGANQRAGPGLGRKASPRLPVRSVTTVP